MREHAETIYATADAATSSRSNDGDSQKAWRAIRRPSDMVSVQRKQLYGIILNM